MVDIGSCMPDFIVFSTTSLWLSSMRSAPSVPRNSIQVLEKLGYPGGRLQPPPTTNARPLSIVTVIHWQSGMSAPVAARIAPKASCEYTRAGFAGSRHHSTKSRSCVDSIAAGESFDRPVIFLPRPRVMCRLTSALTGLPIVPSRTHCLTYAYFGLKRCE